MPDLKSIRQQMPIVVILLLNLMPVYGVFVWQWKTFDLIFLYWLENVLVGVFTVMRMLVRPNAHILMLIPALFMAGFFSVHYGGFTFVHGIFVFSLFADKSLDPGIDLNSLLETSLFVLVQQQLIYAVIALMLLQVYFWIRDILLARSYSLSDLMVSPYRRIFILHITIMASGFLLLALKQPIAGLLVLIGLKVMSDLYQYKTDEKKRLEPLSTTKKQFSKMKREGEK